MPTLLASYHLYRSVYANCYQCNTLFIRPIDPDPLKNQDSARACRRFR
jgi:hypothetical protein